MRVIAGGNKDIVLKKYNSLNGSQKYKLKYDKEFPILNEYHLFLYLYFLADKIPSNKIYLKITEI